MLLAEVEGGARSGAWLAEVELAQVKGGAARFEK